MSINGAALELEGTLGDIEGAALALFHMVEGPGVPDAAALIWVAGHLAKSAAEAKEQFANLHRLAVSQST